MLTFLLSTAALVNNALWWYWVIPGRRWLTVKNVSQPDQTVVLLCDWRALCPLS